MSAGPSRTAETPLVGAEGYGPGLAADLSTRFGLDEAVAVHLARSYGGEAVAVLDMGRERGLLERLHPGHPYLEAEVRFAKEREHAVTADDVLERRLRLGFLDRAAAESVRNRVDELLRVH